MSFNVIINEYFRYHVATSSAFVASAPTLRFHAGPDDEVAGAAPAAAPAAAALPQR